MKKRLVVKVIFMVVVGSTIFAQNSQNANFGKYPIDYEIAYMRILGYFSPVPTVRDLFGPSAAFATSFRNVPTNVTLEKTSGNADEFTAQLLVTINVPDKGNVRLMRMQVRFEADDMSEMSYVRYVKTVNLMNGEVSEQESYGDQMSDGNILGYFVGIMQIFWDISKFLK
ncbi:MAG: hypothetical protein LBP19_09825 [Treponema sp.]|jgi:hypothetical protein|nr:hypothetical protein [Treponema sp.]